MSRLHIVNTSPYLSTALSSCLDHARTGDALLLIEDGVLAAPTQGRASALVDRAAATGLIVFVLAPDLAARGLASRPLAGQARLVDYTGFVDLVAAHDCAQSWS